jgi:hypothetical protein
LGLSFLELTSRKFKSKGSRRLKWQKSPNQNQSHKWRSERSQRREK